MWERIGEIAIVVGLLWIWSAYYLRFVDRAEEKAKPEKASQAKSSDHTPQSGE